jgi:adenylylsulfate kinase
LNSDRQNPPNAPAANVVRHATSIPREQREKRNGHRGAVVWLTGLPGCGKSTIAHAVEQNLHQLGLQTAVLDGDNVRLGLCADLGFSVDDRSEHARRVAETAKLFLEQGMVVLVALVSPLRSIRDQARRIVPPGDFLEIHCSCPQSICQQRDPKGLYAKAQRGEIAEFTGVSAAYEAPLEPALLLDTENEAVEDSVRRLTRLILDTCQDERPR